MNDNKLIAEFMELEVTPKYNPKEYYVKEYNSGEWYLPEEMQYHASWDWLIPVAQKLIDVYISIDEQDEQDLQQSILYDRVDVVYQIVVEVIKKYNNEKQ